jgi:hypothetical protein
MNDSEIAELLWQSESDTLDFKRDQYPFDGAPDDQRSEILKDILAFANAWRTGPARILIGVEEVKHGRSIPVGTEHLTNRTLQTFVNSKVNRPIAFSYEVYEIDGKSVGVIEVPIQDRPLFLKKRFGRLEAQTVYIRRGDTTMIADPDEIAQMGAKREQARNQPVLAFALGDLEKRSKHGDALEIQATRYSIPKLKSLPGYGTSNPLGININHENEDYYADTAQYLHDVPHLQSFAAVVSNESRITAEQVVVRLRITDPDIDVFAPREERGKPVRDRYMKVMPALLGRTEISIERGATETVVKIDLGDIQAGTEEWSAHSFLLGCRESKSFAVSVSVSAHNLGGPMQFRQAFTFSVTTQSLSVDQIVAFADDL